MNFQHRHDIDLHETEWRRKGTRAYSKPIGMARKILSLVIGLILVVAGLTGFIMFTFMSAHPMPGPIFIAPICVFAFGCAMVWEDLGRIFLGRR